MTKLFLSCLIALSLTNHAYGQAYGGQTSGKTNTTAYQLIPSESVSGQYRDGAGAGFMAFGSTETYVRVSAVTFSPCEKLLINGTFKYVKKSQLTLFESTYNDCVDDHWKNVANANKADYYLVVGSN